MADIVTIDRVGSRGEGVALTPDGLRFVPYALAGEAVEIDASGKGQSRLLQVVAPSPQRVAPFCRYFGACGGCAIQHWQHEEYLAWKRGLVVAALAQAGIETSILPIVDAHGLGRRRITLHARRDAGGALRVGFAAPGSHTVIDVAHCPILVPVLADAIPAARDIADALISTGKPLDIQITATQGGLDVDVRGSGPLGAAYLATLARIAEAHKLARVTRHGELVLQRTPPVVTMGRAQVTLPPASFLQATAAGEEALAMLVLDQVGKAKTIADLFCGAGPFAFRLAEKARVAAFDAATDAIEALTQAAAKTPGLRPVTASTRDLFRRPLVPQELRNFDALVFDPPRQGAQAQATQIAASQVQVVIAVSCNVATFVRDARILIAGGYRLIEVAPVDQFRHTPHVELVAKFIR